MLKRAALSFAVFAAALASPAASQVGVTEIDVCTTLSEVEVFVRDFADGTQSEMTGGYRLYRVWDDGHILVADFDPVVRRGSIRLYLRFYRGEDLDDLYRPNGLRPVNDSGSRRLGAAIRRDMTTLFPCGEKPAVTATEGGAPPE